MNNNFDINTYITPMNLIMDLKERLLNLEVTNSEIYLILDQLTNISDVLDQSSIIEQTRELLKNDFSQVMNNLDHLVFKLKKTPEKKYVFTLIAGKLAKEIGLSEELHLNKSVYDIMPKKTLKKLTLPVEKTFSGTTNKLELRLFNKYLFVTLSPFITDGEINEIVGSVSDITELKNSRLIVENMAYHDPLTDLPNRRRLDEDLSDYLKFAKERHKNLAVLSIDLDHFKHINDTLGHSTGDIILIMAGDRLQKVNLKHLAKRYSLYHLGGDEFVFVFYDFEKENAVKACQYLLNIFKNPFMLENDEIHINITIGLSLFPTGGGTPEQLVKNADTALFVAKQNGRNKFLFYNEAMSASIVKKLQIESDLRKALVSNDQFQLHYQPQVDLMTGEITGVEALIRWYHPQKGLISPGAFIEVAEESNLIIPIGEWVLKEACSQLKKWQKAGYEHLTVSVNISTKHFQHESFTYDVAKILKDVRLAPKYLELEITENSLLDQTDATINTLTKLRQLGVKIAIDDFGTGYSSLIYLKNFPITTLKIDQIFISELPENKSDRAIVSSIINLAHNFDLKIIAEGVETSEAYQYLQQEHCNEMQGYYFSRPLCANNLQKLLKKNTTLANF